MVIFPNCKINIGLHILEKRADGYHNLETIFYPIAINDIVEIIESPESGVDINFSSSGLPVEGPQDNNLCIKAYRLLRAQFPHLPPIKMHLHKAIPMGAGLGGGSADAAFTLQLLNSKFSLQLTQGQLMGYALTLGSDCPFFLLNKACHATGRGEILNPISLDLSGHSIIIINPGIHISTALAFSSIKKEKRKSSLSELIANPISSWKDCISNDFEKTVFESFPEIARIKTELYLKGAIYASMSGSGSSIYGIFEKGNTPTFNFPQQYFQKWV